MNSSKQSPFRVLHISVFRNPGRGHLSQLAFEARAAPNLHPLYEWQTVALLVNRQGKRNAFEVVLPAWSKRLGLHKLYAWIYILRRAAKFDVVLLRDIGMDPFGLFLAPLVKNLVTVHHTRELEELKTTPRTIKWKFVEFFEAHIHPWGMKRILGVAGVTHEIAIHEQMRFPSAKVAVVYPNGIDYDSITCTDQPPSHTEVIHAVFVAAHFLPRQGLDLLLDELERRGDHRLHLHLVGQLTNEQSLRVSEVEKVAPITVHGEIDADQMPDVYDGMDLAIATLALGRAGMTEATTLKVREYLAAGLPVYSGYRDAAIPEDFPYYYEEVGSVSLDHILEFAASVAIVRRTEIRDAAMPYIEKTNVMRRLVEDIAQAKRDLTARSRA